MARDHRTVLRDRSLIHVNAEARPREIENASLSIERARTREPYQSRKLASKIS